MPWTPTSITTVYHVVGSSTCPLYVETDQGPAYCKVMGNPQGPDVLTCDLVGTWLASWLGLPTLDFAVVDFPSELETPLSEGCTSVAGPALLTRAVTATPWSGDADDVALLDNPEHLAGFVALDTWIRNCDRHCVRAGQVRRNLENVLFTAEGAKNGRFRALAIDHGCAFVCGRPLRAADLRIGAARDETLYGLFPGFQSAVTRSRTVTFVERLRAFSPVHAAACLALVPRAWACAEATRDALAELCCDRADFVARHLEQWLAEPCGWHTSLPLGRTQ